MPYIGGQPTANFVDIPSVERFNGNNSTTSFTLSRTVGNDQDIVVSVDGVIQDTNKYSVSGTTLTFTAAPASGDVIQVRRKAAGEIIRYLPKLRHDEILSRESIDIRFSKSLISMKIVHIETFVDELEVSPSKIWQMQNLDTV